MPAVVAHVRRGTQTPLLVVADGISGAVGICAARHHGDAAHTRVGIGDRAFRTEAFIGAGSVDALRALAAPIRCRALVDVVALDGRVAGVAGRTLARVAARAVRAHRVDAAPAGWAMLGVAFVDVHTAGRDVTRIIRPALVAHAERFASVRATVGVRAAFHVFARRLACDARRRPDETSAKRMN